DILTAETTYWWRVSSIDPHGSNEWSEVSSARSFTTAPPAVIDVISDTQTVVAGRASDLIRVQLQDADGNPVRISSPQRLYLFSSSGTGEFSEQQDPFVPVTYADVLPGQSSVLIYYRDDTVGNPTLTI